MIKYEQLEGRPDEWSDAFKKAAPFPHLVIDDLFDPDGLRNAVGAFPTIDEMAPKAGGTGGVFELSDRTLLPSPLIQVSDELLGERFTSWLSSVVGEKLVTDPAGDWGALRQSVDGVEGKIHVPPLSHRTKPWQRRLTLILTLTEAIDERNGGCFQMWDAERVSPLASVAPLFNRAVVFLATPEAFHNASRTSLGPGQTRKVMQALYFRAS